MQLRQLERRSASSREGEPFPFPESDPQGTRSSVFFQGRGYRGASPMCGLHCDNIEPNLVCSFQTLIRINLQSRVRHLSTTASCKAFVAEPHSEARLLQVSLPKAASAGSRAAQFQPSSSAHWVCSAQTAGLVRMCGLLQLRACCSLRRDLPLIGNAMQAACWNAT